MISAVSTQNSQNSPSSSNITRKRSRDCLANIEQQTSVKTQRLSQDSSPINAHSQFQNSLNKIQISEEITEISIGDQTLNIKNELEIFEQTSFDEILTKSKSCFIGIAQTVANDPKDPNKKMVQHYLIENIAEWIEDPKKSNPLTGLAVEKINLFTLFKGENSVDFFGSFERNKKDQQLSNLSKILISCFTSDDEVTQLVNWDIIAKIYARSFNFPLNRDFNNEINTIKPNEQKSKEIIKSILEFKHPLLAGWSDEDKKIYIDFCSCMQVVRLNKPSSQFEANDYVSPSEMVSVLKAFKNAPSN